jgi:hypothetical protein
MTPKELSHLHHADGPWRRVPSAGISILEFIGCLCALVGGAWLGAMYLGVDVRHLAYVALKDSQLLDRVPEKWRPAAPDAKAGAEAPTPEQLAQRVEHELSALRQEVAALRTSRDGKSTVASGGDVTGAASGSNQENGGADKALSLAYWNRLNQIVGDETALQTDSESAASEGNAAQVTAIKARVCRFAASAIRAIPSGGVDSTAGEFGKQLANWYDHGGDLYEDAVRIWESPARGHDGHPLSEAWDQSKAQHRNEGRLLSERAVVVREALTRRFGGEFAALAKLIGNEQRPVQKQPAEKAPTDVNATPRANAAMGATD